MEIKLSQPFAANSAVDEYDVRQIKKTLNRLGYYQPYEKTGITGIPDAAVFAALKTFQKDQGLKATGAAKPGDDTLKALNKEASKTPEGQYIWRTVEDDKVRSSHAAFNRTLRSWDDDPHPGEDFNCRCWAELVSDKIEKEKLPPPKIERPKIPGTDIPDRGIPEGGWPGSPRFDPWKSSGDDKIDPGIFLPYDPVYPDFLPPSPDSKRDT